MATALDDYANDWWSWASGGSSKDGIAVVAFGDSWVDGEEEGDHLGKGRGWASWLCEEVSDLDSVRKVEDFRTRIIWIS